MILYTAPARRVGTNVKYQVRPGTEAAMTEGTSLLQVYVCSLTWSSKKQIYCPLNRLWEQPGAAQSLRAITQQQQLSAWLWLWELAALLTHNTNLEESNRRQGISKLARRGSFRDHELLCLFSFFQHSASEQTWLLLLLSAISYVINPFSGCYHTQNYVLAQKTAPSTRPEGAYHLQLLQSCLTSSWQSDNLFVTIDAGGLFSLTDKVWGLRVHIMTSSCLQEPLHNSALSLSNKISSGYLQFVLH